MTGNAICSKCSKAMDSVNIHRVPGGDPLAGYDCIFLCCPHCNVVISAQVDPIAIQRDIQNDIDNIESAIWDAQGSK